MINIKSKFNKFLVVLLSIVLTIIILLVVEINNATIVDQEYLNTLKSRNDSISARVFKLNDEVLIKCEKVIDDFQSCNLSDSIRPNFSINKPLNLIKRYIDEITTQRGRILSIYKENLSQALDDVDTENWMILKTKIIEYDNKINGCQKELELLGVKTDEPIAGLPTARIKELQKNVEIYKDKKQAVESDLFDIMIKVDIGIIHNMMGKIERKLSTMDQYHTNIISEIDEISKYYSDEVADDLVSYRSKIKSNSQEIQSIRKCVQENDSLITLQQKLLDEKEGLILEQHKKDKYLYMIYGGVGIPGIMICLLMLFQLLKKDKYHEDTTH